MAIVDQVSEQLTSAMKARDAARTSALRNIRAAFIAAMKEDGAATLSDERALEHLRRLAKQRAESIEAFASAGRVEMADAERAELAVIEGFLPRLADEPTTRQWVIEAIATAGATHVRESGKVMGALMKAHRADVDSKIAAKLVAELLNA